MASSARASMRRPSDVEVGDLQRVVLDELAPRFDDIAHQGREDLVGGDRVLDPHLQQAARVGIDRGVPQLFGVHLAQALEALDLAAPLCFLQQPRRSEEHTSELQSLMRISYAVFCLKKKKKDTKRKNNIKQYKQPKNSKK